LADDDDHRLIDHRGTGARLGVSCHPHALNERLVDSLLNSYIIKNMGKPLAIIVLTVHSTPCLGQVIIEIGYQIEQEAGRLPRGK
jgi:hypothetical protein